MRLLTTAATLAALVLANVASAEPSLWLSDLFSDHAVLQRDQPIRVWGRCQPGGKVELSLADEKATATADESGKWQAELAARPAGGPYTLKVASGDEEVVAQDVLIGDVWVCSGQSNMQWRLDQSRDAELAIAAADEPMLRLMRIDTIGSQDPTEQIDTQWRVSSPKEAGSFSGVGYFFGRQLQEALGVPIGLIDNSWGGSACEAWVPPAALADEAMYGPLRKRWSEIEANSDEASLRRDYAEKLTQWREQREKALAEGRSAPGRPWINAPLFGNQRPGNLFAARVEPIRDFPITGVIWYQGESNAGRAYQYRELFPTMIGAWRDAWGQADLPFYWVQLADFKPEKPAPAPSDWAELREAQTMTLDRLENVGQALAIDLGEANDIHPKNKQSVASRLARLALADVYGSKMPARSPRLEECEFADDAAQLTLTDCEGGLRTFDGVPPQGFAIAGSDQQFHWADAKITGKNTVRLSSAEVREPVAVRYAWADNPRVNLYNSAWLPVTPFRTDDWPGVTAEQR
ncbi:hypothetical protein Pla175_19710 [Pirellulimonas nuda]|uniref:Sialate O-acetylesterase domain-containing protein n=1 Tax=Pirellulimonas nuda TaxID=2528009 RepID=A0A518DAT6_9BACT|nr:sialate O-acetylesterase [Pirellulimonas nuda]QDU88591.1 hypothetical protein Pla175_19710 [Pirellulimonas nuda]